MVRTVNSPRPAAEVYDYLVDFTTTKEWEPATESTTLVATAPGGGDGVGAKYRNRTRFLGRTTELTYVVEEADPPKRIRMRGENKTVIAKDTMTLVPTTSGGTRVTYQAEFEFRGLARFVAPLLAPALKRLGDNAQRGMEQALA